MDRVIFTSLSGANAAMHRQQVLSNNLANISKALVRVAPTIAAARERMDAGTLHQADIAPDLLEIGRAHV